MRKLFFILLLINLLFYRNIYAENEKSAPKIYSKNKIFVIKNTESKIKIDGVINKEEWKDAIIIELNNEIMPGENILAPVKTECFMVYTDSVFYVAFKAYDKNPSKIRAHFSDRDDAWRDDNVGIILDTFNDENRAFAFFSNPLGVQADEIYSNGGSYEDDSWDAIWDSAGKITNFGYVVEIAIPFSSLQFQSSHVEQIWGFAPLRIYSRSKRHQISSFKHNRDNDCLICQFLKLKGFKSISSGKNIELDPTITGIRTDERKEFPVGPLEKLDSSFEFGISGKWGFTNNLTLSGAINPDFSQVEADSDQLDINTRFALYYQEKRPFFLEGNDFFSTPLETVYTRTVANPDWGIKLTGKEGKNAIGFFTSQDATTNLIFPGLEGSDSTYINQKSYSSVLRYRRDIGKSSTLGVLITDREGDNYFNRIGGIDGLLRITGSDKVYFQMLGSNTLYPSEIAKDYNQNVDSFSGSAIMLSYLRQKRSYSWKAGYSSLSPDFRADIGFIPQVNVRKYFVGAGYTFWGKEKSVFSQIEISGDFSQEEDYDGNLLEREGEIELVYQGPMQSFLWVNLTKRRKVFEGISFDQDRQHMRFNIKPTGNFSFYMHVSMGDEIDYENVRAGKKFIIVPEINYNIGKHFRLTLSHSYNKLKIKGNVLFLAKLYQVWLVYHLNKKIFLRAIIQHTHIKRNVELYGFEVDPIYKKLSTQLLFSYKLNPRTVLFLGYTDNYLGYEDIKLTQSNRTFFMKIGYALSL
jgi:hypothetical protein